MPLCPFASILTAAGLVAISADAVQAAIVVDDFEDGDFEILTDGGTSSESGLAVLGGTRDATLTFNGASGSGQISWWGESFALVSVTPPPAFTSYSASLTLTYDAGATDPMPTSGLNIDLTQGGLNDRFRIDVEFADDALIWIAVGDRQGNVNWPYSVALPGWGVYDVLFSDVIGGFGVDLTDVAFLHFRITADGTAGENANKLTGIGSIIAVPEPASIAVVLPAALSLTFRRRRALR